MTLAKIHLRPVDRRLVSAILSRSGGTLADARVVREIRRRLDLRANDHTIDKLTEQLKDEYGCILHWDALLYPADLIEDLRDSQRAEPVGDEQKRLDAAISKIEALATSQEFTLDDSFLRALKEIGAEIDWNFTRAQDPVTRELKEVATGAPPALLEVVADVMDELADAVASSGAPMRKTSKASDD